ncbi:MAG: chromosome segregation protein SMC, partial [Hyphomonadaceae bacterium]|nr:chromosome segregation protein SMC [Hyphomonadaceae bacterium]
MHITELRLSGFKSFVDPVRLVIDAGLTGVVGPNGCGKSNLLEAVRWAMGATSAKAMRAGDMDDVIFAGSGHRPAREHAEVILVIDAAGAKPPPGVPPADVLEISRKIRREAGSTYRINGREVRAKDVQLLFADASTGANSPALVRQGQISELIAAKPENRRRVLEEAAGIAGLHARRHEADLKLAAAANNLARLDEVAAEIDAQRQGLKRQARLAERYRGLAEEMRRTEALALHRRWIEAGEGLAQAEAAYRAAERDVAAAAEAASIARRAVDEAQAAQPALREEELVAAAVLRKLEGERVSVERDVAEAAAALARAADALSRLTEDDAREARLREDAEAALARLAAEAITLSGDDETGALAAAQTRAEEAEAARATAEAALDALNAAAARIAVERAGREAAAREARARLARAEARLAEIARDAQAAAAPADLDARLVAAETALADAVAAAERAAGAVDDAEQAARGAEARWQSADAAFRAADAQRSERAAEVRALEKLAADMDAGAFPAVLADVDAEPGFERAVAAALGDDIEASLDENAPLRWAGAAARTVGWPEGVTPLAPHVTAPDELSARLSLCGLVARADGPRLMASLSAGARLVSREGDLWRWDGFVRSAEAPSPAAVRLEQRNRLTQARGELAAAQSVAAQTEQAMTEAREARQAADLAARQARTAAPAAATLVLKATGARDALAADARRLAERRAAIARQREGLEAERAEASGALDAAEAARHEIPPVDEAALTGARTAAEEARAGAADAKAALALLTKAEAARQARRAAIAAEQADWARRRDGAAARIEKIAAAQACEAAAMAAAKDAPAAAQARLEVVRDQFAIAERRRAAAADALATAEAKARDAEATARAAEHAHATQREARAGAEARAAGAREKLAAIEAAAQDQIGCAAEELAAKAGALMTQALARAPLGDIDRKLERLRAERDAAGPVNLRAEEELAEVETRLAALERERADVDGAILKLKQAIGRLNAEGRQRLMEAFTVVNGHFAQLFATLFEGGQAELRLTESDDPLAAGLEIFACPPGKRLSTLSLMSGGEQALTATALIFAVFLANP